VNSPGQLEALCGLVRQEGCFAFDTEFIRERSYRPRVCLIQVATSAGVWLIAPERVDAGPFWRLVGDGQIATVLFSGAQDLEICYYATGAAGRNVFDVQVAAGLVGMSYPSSYAAVLREVLGIEIERSETYTNWAQRPLTLRQVAYAVEDVAHLLPLYRHFGARLESLERLGWMREEMAALEADARYDPRQKAGTVSGRAVGRMSPRELAVLAELARWRERVAHDRDLPVRRVVSDECLCELARRELADASAVLGVRGFPHSDGDGLARDALEAVRRAAELPDGALPPREGRSDDEGHRAALVDLAAAVGRSIWLAESVSPRLLAARKDYEELVDAVSAENASAPAAPRLLTGWRRQCVGLRLARVLSGEAAVRTVRRGSLRLLTVSE